MENAAEESSQTMKCPKCAGADVEVFTISNTVYCKCRNCGHGWKIELEAG